MSKPAAPKGTRDFLPFQARRREYIFSTIRRAFEKYGYEPIETPAMEMLSTLTGKYGEEGDRLIFKILNSGDYLAKADEALLKDKTSAALTAQISEKALRYDLTVPFARFVVNHFNELTFPFKRYQIQPVWRADRPQKGRYREFYQCDADVVGSTSLLYEVEMIQLFDEVLSDLQLDDFTVKINNRKILSGVAEVAGISDRFSDLTVAIDKLDKIGQEGVVKELQDRGIPKSAIRVLEPLFSETGSNSEKMAQMRTMLQSSQTGITGIEEVSEVLRHIEALGLRKAKLQVDFTLARGLDYYTGAIFEVVAGGVNMGSICGGGRYDDLTSIFGRDHLPGVGISFGADRIYDVLNELSLFPENLNRGPEVLFINFGSRETDYALGLLKNLRQAGFAAEIYPEAAKMKKQMKYADDKRVRFVALAGENEINAGTVTIKNMETGAQQEVPAAELTAFLRS
jgi:histidyl-tRNA synthetase